MEKGTLGMKDVICRKCGKMFLPAPEHIYRDIKGLYCSWHCFNHRNDGRCTRQKMVEVYGKDGELLRRYPSAEKAAEHLGFDDKRIRNACATGEKYQGFLWKYKSEVAKGEC